MSPACCFAVGTGCAQGEVFLYPAHSIAPLYYYYYFKKKNNKKPHTFCQTKKYNNKYIKLINWKEIKNIFVILLIFMPFLVSLVFQQICCLNYFRLTFSHPTVILLQFWNNTIFISILRKSILNCMCNIMQRQSPSWTVEHNDNNNHRTSAAHFIHVVTKASLKTFD